MEQIESLYAALKEENVKKGWTQHSGVVGEAALAAIPAEEAPIAVAEEVKPKRASRKKAEPKSEPQVEVAADPVIAETDVKEPTPKKPRASRKKAE